MAKMCNMTVGVNLERNEAFEEFTRLASKAIFWRRACFVADCVITGLLICLVVLKLI